MSSFLCGPLAGMPLRSRYAPHVGRLRRAESTTGRNSLVRGILENFDIFSVLFSSLFSHLAHAKVKTLLAPNSVDIMKTHYVSSDFVIMAEAGALAPSALRLGALGPPARRPRPSGSAPSALR